MIIYKSLTSTLDDDSSYIGMVEEGDVGKYNRANRSLSHFVENMGSFLVSFVLAGFVFPFPVFMLMLIYSIGRVLHQTGYSQVIIII